MSSNRVSDSPQTPPAASRGRAKKLAVLSSSESSEVESPPAAPRKKRAASSSTAAEGGEPSGAKRMKQRPPRLDLSAVSAAPSELQWQRAMDNAVLLFAGLDVSHDALTLLPDRGTLETFSKAAQLWAAEKRIALNLTYTTTKCFYQVMGRVLFAYVLRSAGVPSDWNPAGLAVWRHQSADAMHCLHGLRMLNKEQVIEMDINSEAGQKALKEQAARSKVVTNRWNRQVVQLRNEDALCCPEDAAVPGTGCSHRSCGMAFTDGPKAQMALRQIAAFQAASYSKMETAGSHMVIVSACDCNYGPTAPPLLGRQVPKMTVFAVNNTENIERERVQDSKLLATLDNPAVFVFQCCNPVFRASKNAPQKSCDYKISAVDLISAIQLAKQFWRGAMEKDPPVVLPEFKWRKELQYQTTLLPQGHEDNDESLF